MNIRDFEGTLSHPAGQTMEFVAPWAMPHLLI